MHAESCFGEKKKGKRGRLMSKPGGCFFLLMALRQTDKKPLYSLSKLITSYSHLPVQHKCQQVTGLDRNCF